MGLLIMMGIFAFGVVIGVPVAFALGIGAVSAFYFEGLPLIIAFQRIISGINVFSLLAIPFFIFAGELMFHGGIAVRLVRLASSAVADVSALGSILIPVMKEKGYDEDYAVNVTVTSSIAGIMIPPSHNMILFAVATGGGVSITQLFLSGIIPGVVMCICLALVAYLVAVKRKYKSELFPGYYTLFMHFVTALPGLFTAVIIVGGVLSGIFTVTESGAFGTMYAFVVTIIVYRALTWKNFKIAVINSVKTTSMVMILVASASAFGYMLTFYQVPSQMISFMNGISSNPIVILLMINIMLLVLGMIMDMAA